MPNATHEMMPILSAITAAGVNSFSLELSNADNFDCQEVVRVIPQKRLVCRGAFHSQPVYAKIFIGKSARHYALRDKDGIQALQQGRIETPDLLLECALSGGIHILIYDAIQNSKNGEEVWRSSEPHSRFTLMQKLVKTVAEHHQAGLLQTDLYLKNFLVQQKPEQPDLIYTLDGDGIRRVSPLFQKHQKLRNLATLFSKMDVLDDVWIAELYRQYCLQLDIMYLAKDEAKVQYLTKKIRHQVAKGYADKKVFRNCTDVKVMQSCKRFVAVASEFKVDSQALASLDQYLADSKRNIKNGNTCTIAKATLADRSVIIKRYNIKNFWHGLNRALRASRAAKSWANAHRLLISDIATPKPLALVEERLGWFRRRAYYLSEYVDAPDAMQCFAQTSKLEDKETVARNLATLFYKLYLLKFSHGDCKATNIKIVDFVPILIDLDGMQAHFGSIFGNWWFERKHVKDLKRLMKNWANDAEVTKLLKQALLLRYSVQRPNIGEGILFRAGIV